MADSSSEWPAPAAGLCATMAPRPCIHCARLITSGTYCASCQAARWADQGRRRAPRPWYGGDWAKRRAAYLKGHPACENCGATTSLEVDHVIPRSFAAGLMTLCRPCHHAKTAKDQAQAKRLRQQARRA